MTDFYPDYTAMALAADNTVFVGFTKGDSKAGHFPAGNLALVVVLDATVLLIVLKRKQHPQNRTGRSGPDVCRQ